MKSTYVSDLRPNQDAASTFLVQTKDIRQKKSGDPYLSLILVDRTGEISAKMWDNVGEVMDTFDRDDFVTAKGRVQVFQNRPQFTIHKMQRVDEAGIDFSDFFPASRRDPDEMFAELRQVVTGMDNPHLKVLLDAFLDDEEFARRFRQAPAAKSVHHACLGGLIEHVLSLCHLSRLTAAHYEFVDLDLLLAGVILHDIGKIHELSYHRSFAYTDVGQLLGHIVIGLRMIDDKLREIPDFPPRLRTLVEHIMVSHHGDPEFGSPKVPLFAEALLVHLLDNIDSKMENVRALVEKDQQVEGFWTAYNPALERTILKKDTYLEGGRQAPAGPVADDGAQEPGARRQARQPQNQSLFGEKLQDALKREP